MLKNIIQNTVNKFNKQTSDHCAHYFRRFSRKSQVEFTKDRYPRIRRGNYNILIDRHIKYFEYLLGNSRVLTNPSELEDYNVDWLDQVKGCAQLALKPRTAQEVSQILSFCNAERLAVCPRGGHTGLLGGSVSVFDEIIIDMQLMNKIIDLDETSGILVCEAGCILENLDNYLMERGLMMPLDLGAKGSCQIGGNVSTNAGGVRLVRYGNLHGTVLGLEAVKADGEVIDCLSTLKKDNTGYHLKHLFIGSEGTLGIITKVAIQCPTSPRGINIAFLGLRSYEKVIETFKIAKDSLGEILSACEMMDADSMVAVVDQLKLKAPIEEYPFYMLIETSGSNLEHDEEKINKFLEYCLDKGLVENGTVTNEPGRMKNIWEVRERMAESFHKYGYVFIYDFSLPLQLYYSIVPIMKKRLGSYAVNVNGMGHLGDGNLHLNICVKEYSKKVHDMIEPFVFEYVAKHKGSISAEHGIGFLKANHLHYSNSGGALNLMNQIKKMMDPNAILNPYKVLPD